MIFYHKYGRSSLSFIFIFLYTEGFLCPVIIVLPEATVLPAAVLLKKAAGIETASGEPNKKKVATLGRDKIKEIAQEKMPDLNASDIDSAMLIIEGTARSMGIEVVD